MGCKLSSFAFGLTTQSHYESTYSFLTRGGEDGSCLKAATDDVIIFLKARRGDEANLYRQIGKIRTVLNTAEDKIGLTFINDKELLLLPPGWHLKEELLPHGMSADKVRSTTCDDPQLQGIEIVGSPVGSNQFCKNFIETSTAKIIADTH
jgi:hypothetical protein